ncbi:MAG: response regulator transcription factor [Acidimicrobiia bacterium]|jgi:two-component system OmpR family response regulator
MRILVVEDEPKLLSLLQRGLREQGYSVDGASNGTDAIWSATEWDYDAIILDISIPPPDGIQVARELRKRGRWSPILFLTVRDDITDRVEGLDAGGDDYVTKPFAFDELYARVRALIRRAPPPRPSVLQSGNLTLDPATHEVTAGPEPVDLSPKEFALLEYLMRHESETVSRSDILDHVWDFAYDGASNVVDVYIGYLRSKIGASRIDTIRGVGYRLVGDAP